MPGTVQGFKKLQIIKPYPVSVLKTEPAHLKSYFMKSSPAVAYPDSGWSTFLGPADHLSSSVLSIVATPHHD